MNKVSTKNINQVQSMSSEKPKRILPEADSALSPPHPTLPFPVPYTEHGGIFKKINGFKLIKCFHKTPLPRCVTDFRIRF